MRPFALDHARSPGDAIAGFAAGGAAQFLAGGTTLLDLMKLDVMRPDQVVDINALDQTDAGRIVADSNGLRLGGLVRMADAANHAAVRQGYPMIAQSLTLAASQQIRNMASLGGNVLQRTRCPYFRDVSYSQCNKRQPGSGCAAMDGFNRMHAVLGDSDHCIATYPGDFAQALIALDATVDLQGPHGERTIAFAQLHRAPGDRPGAETTWRPGELILGFAVPAKAWARRSLYLKVRDRESYEFALASAAVALDMDGSTVREARIALGGVATVPWRARDAEAALAGKTIDDVALRQAADAAFAAAHAREHNAFKLELGKRTLMRALGQAAAMEI
jgi:xanthine dehydrogenase YagS FAD-binding subunit